jgi:hypothetical protein
MLASLLGLYCLAIVLLYRRFWYVEKSRHRSREFFKCGFALDWLGLHALIVTRFQVACSLFDRVSPILGRAATHSAFARLRMAIQAMPSVLNHFRIWLSTSPKASIWTLILMANRDQQIPQEIWHRLATRSWRLMGRAWIVPVRLTRTRFLVKNRLLVTNVLEYS